MSVADQGLASLASTIGDPAWMSQNAAGIAALFPLEWTKVDQRFVMSVGLHIKIKGVVWTTEDQLNKLMVFFERVKICETRQMPGNVLWIRRAPVAGQAPPPPPPPTQRQQTVQEFMDKLAANRRDG